MARALDTQVCVPSRTQHDASIAFVESLSLDTLQAFFTPGSPSGFWSSGVTASMLVHGNETQADAVAYAGAVAARLPAPAPAPSPMPFSSVVNLPPGTPVFRVVPGVSATHTNRWGLRDSVCGCWEMGYSMKCSHLFTTSGPHSPSPLPPAFS